MHSGLFASSLFYRVAPSHLFCLFTFSLPSPLEGEGIFQREERALEKLGEGFYFPRLYFFHLYTKSMLFRLYLSYVVGVGTPTYFIIFSFYRLTRFTPHPSPFTLHPLSSMLNRFYRFSLFTTHILPFQTNPQHALITLRHPAHPLDIPLTNTL